MDILNMTGAAAPSMFLDMGVTEILPEDSEYVKQAYSYKSPPVKSEVEFRCEALLRLALSYQAEKVLIDPPAYMVRELSWAMRQNGVECYVPFRRKSGDTIMKL